MRLSQTGKVALAALIMMTAALSIVSCGQGPLGADSKQGSTLATGGTGSQNPNNPYQAQAQTILQNNCASCHTVSSGPANVFDIADPNHLISAGLVTPGQPGQSSLFSAISNGIMPPTGPLSASDQSVISSWITAMANESTTTTTMGGGPTTTLPNATTTTTLSGPAVSFQTLESTIFAPKCVGCHSNFGSYSGVKAAVNMNSPSSSPIYTMTSSGSMPQGGPALTSTEENEILMWIQQGAQDN